MWLFLRTLGWASIVLVVLVLFFIVVIIFLLRPAKGKKTCEFYSRKSPIPWVDKIRGVILASEGCAQINASDGLPVFDYNQNGKPYLFGVLQGTTLVLRGTDDWFEWVIDSNVNHMTPWPEMHPSFQVHAGALRVARIIAKQIGQRPVHTVYAYSLGALVGALFLYGQYAERGIRGKARFIGTPPVGNYAFVRAFNRVLPDVKYINNPRDYIAHPFFLPHGWFFGYYSCGQLIEAPRGTVSYPYNLSGIRSIIPHLSYI